PAPARPRYRKTKRARLAAANPPPQDSGSPFRSCQRKQNPGGGTQRSISPGQSRREYDESHNVRCCWNVSVAKHSHKRTFRDPGSIPGHHTHQNNNCSEIDTSKDCKGEPDGAGNFLW